MRFCIHVIDDDENPAEGEKVTLRFSAWAGRSSEDAETDEEGNAWFETDDEDDEELSFNLWIGQYDYGEQTITDGESLTFTIEEGVGLFEWTIHVVKGDDEPFQGRQVHLSFAGILGGWLDEYTDEDGKAEFRMHTSKDTLKFEVIIDDENQGEYTVERGDSLTFNIRPENDDDDADKEKEEEDE